MDWESAYLPHGLCVITVVSPFGCFTAKRCLGGAVCERWGNITDRNIVGWMDFGDGNDTMLYEFSRRLREIDSKVYELG